VTGRQIELIEVGPRDGLQNESAILSTADKLALIAKAVAAGVRRIEVASFVHPGLVPQMADAEAVCAGLTLPKDVVSIGLVLNRRGLTRALATSVDEISMVVSASDGFGKANQGRTSDETVEDAVEIIELARQQGRRAQAIVSVAFGCPFDGDVEPTRVIEIARRLAKAGPREIALADTIGIANPDQVSDLLRRLNSAIPGVPLRIHLHDTRGMAIANAEAALEAGVTMFDAAIGGAGGCPFAPGSTGNVATERLLGMFEQRGLEAGIARDRVSEITPWLSGLLGRELPGEAPVTTPKIENREE